MRSILLILLIEPGLAETNFSNVRFKSNDEKADEVYEGTEPLTVDDVADIIYWVNARMPNMGAFGYKQRKLKNRQEWT